MSNPCNEYYSEEYNENNNDNCNERHNNNCNESYNDKHVHEFTGSVKLAEEGEDRHNHRTAGITSEPRYCENGRHYHLIKTETDSAPDDHHHPILVRTGLDIKIRGTNKHVHAIKGATRVVDQHCHNFEFATLTERPLK